MGAVFAIVQFTVERFLRDEITNVVDPIETSTEERFRKAEEATGIQQRRNDAQHRLLQWNDADLADYQLESDDYDRGLLEQIAKKRRIPIKRPKSLHEAAERAKKVRDRARANALAIPVGERNGKVSAHQPAN